MRAGSFARLFSVVFIRQIANSEFAYPLAYFSPRYLLSFYFSLFYLCPLLLSFVSLFLGLCSCHRYLLLLPFPFHPRSFPPLHLALARDTNTRINSRLEPRRRYPIIASRNFIKCALPPLSPLDLDAIVLPSLAARVEFLSARRCRTRICLRPD